jgi:hypothetical protein
MLHKQGLPEGSVAETWEMSDVSGAVRGRDCLAAAALGRVRLRAGTEFLLSYLPQGVPEILEA